MRILTMLMALLVSSSIVRADDAGTKVSGRAIAEKPKPEVTFYTQLLKRPKDNQPYKIAFKDFPYKLRKLDLQFPADLEVTLLSSPKGWTAAMDKSKTGIRVTLSGPELDLSRRTDFSFRIPGSFETVQFAASVSASEKPGGIQLIEGTAFEFGYSEKLKAEAAKNEYSPSRQFLQVKGLRALASEKNPNTVIQLFHAEEQLLEELNKTLYVVCRSSTECPNDLASAKSELLQYYMNNKSAFQCSWWEPCGCFSCRISTARLENLEGSAEAKRLRFNREWSEVAPLHVCLEVPSKCQEYEGDDGPDPINADQGVEIIKSFFARFPDPFYDRVKSSAIEQYIEKFGAGKTSAKQLYFSRIRRLVGNKSQ
jgi:hypothetical protein